MERLPLLGGSYLARSIIASATRCINYYPEINPKDSLVPMTYYQRPGLVPKAFGPAAPVRCLYQASNGEGYSVIGNNVFWLDSTLTLHLLGSITAGRTNPASMTDNGQAIMLVDGSVSGWTIQLKPFLLSTIGDTKPGSDIIDGLEVALGIQPGFTVAGPNIPIGATVLSNLSLTSVQISAFATPTGCAFTASVAGNTLNVTAVASGALAVGQTLFDISGLLLPGTTIEAFGTGIGGVGTYQLTGLAQNIAAEDMTSSGGGGQAVTFTAPTNFFSLISDPSGIFTGADRVDEIDTFLLFNIIRTTRFGSTLSGGISFDATQFASKSNFQDFLQTLIVNRHEILLLGTLKSEIWYDAGNPTFPFGELPGAYIEHGIEAKYSIASSDISVFWLGRDLQGKGVVFRQRGYQTTRISNHALERAISNMAASADISDAIGFTFQIEGHVFYFLTFPAGDQTWVFDDSIQDPMLAWHQEAWTDGNGQLRRHRANCFASIGGKQLVGDWENGTIYQLSVDAYTDEVAEVVGPLTCIRSFPHIGQVSGPQGIQVSVAGRRLQFKRFWLDLECGTDPTTIAGKPALVTLRWSDDRGRTFGQDVLQSAGELGQYLTQPAWAGLGIARDRIFEISHSIAGPAALNSAWIDVELLDL